jgi:hypothetical protein
MFGAMISTTSCNRVEELKEEPVQPDYQISIITVCGKVTVIIPYDKGTHAVFLEKHLYIPEVSEWILHVLKNAEPHNIEEIELEKDCGEIKGVGI